MLKAICPPRTGGLLCLAARLACTGVIITMMMAASGCAHFKQTQYFEVRNPPDPITGIVQRNYYKTTFSGTGWFQKKYNMRAAYLSKAALDSLRGEPVSIPMIDMPDKNEAAFDDIKKSYLDSAQKAAYVISGRTDKDAEQKPADEKKTPSDSTTNGTTTVKIETPANGTTKTTTQTNTTVTVIEPKKPEGGKPNPSGNNPPPAASSSGQDEKMLNIARQAWYAYLSDGDIISMGEIRNTDSYQFRKLVFYTSAENFDLTTYSNEIDNAISKTEGLARGFKALRDSQRAMAKARADAALSQGRKLIKLLPAAQQPTAEILYDMLAPPVPEQTTNSAAN